MTTETPNPSAAKPSTARRPLSRPGVASAVLGVLALLLPLLGALSVVAMAQGALPGVAAFAAAFGLAIAIPCAAGAYGLRPWLLAPVLITLFVSLVVSCVNTGSVVLRVRGERVTTTVTAVHVEHGRNDVTWKCGLAAVAHEFHCDADSRRGDRVTVVADPDGLVDPARPDDLQYAGTAAAFAAGLAALSAAVLAAGTAAGARRKRRRHEELAAARPAPESRGTVNPSA